jgi:hypothetical protein
MALIVINTSTPNDGLGATLRDAITDANTMFAELYGGVVFKEAGKGLSSNDFTTPLQTKLTNMAADANKNVQADLLQADTAADDFVKNKDSVLPGRTPTQIETFAGTSTFTLPVGAIVLQVLLVRTVLFEFDEWTQATNILTITKTMNTGNRIQITFY